MLEQLCAVVVGLFHARVALMMRDEPHERNGDNVELLVVDESESAMSLSALMQPSNATITRRRQSSDKDFTLHAAASSGMQGESDLPPAGNPFQFHPVRFCSREKVKHGSLLSGNYAPLLELTAQDDTVGGILNCSATQNLIE